MGFLPIAGELKPPPCAKFISPSIEILRLWIDQDKNNQIVLRHAVWDDPFVWGMMLFHIAGHLANDYENAGMDRTEALARIFEGFEAEREAPTDTPRQIN